MELLVPAALAIGGVLLSFAYSSGSRAPLETPRIHSDTGCNGTIHIGADSCSKCGVRVVWDRVDGEWRSFYWYIRRTSIPTIPRQHY